MLSEFELIGRFFTHRAPGTVLGVGDDAALVRVGAGMELAVCSTEPSPFAPGVPTVAATGLPNFESVSPFGILVPRGTAPAIVDRLNQEIARALNKPDVKAKLFSAGSEVVVNSPEAFAAKMRTDIERVGKLVQSGLRAQ